MSLSLLLDENISPLVAEELRQLGYDAIHVREIGLKGGRDAHVLRFASQEGRCLVTLDADFANVRRYPPGSHAGIVRLRLAFAPAETVLAVLRSLLPRLSDLEPGALVVSDGRRYRVRRARS